MSGYGIDDVPTMEINLESSKILEGSDAIQESLMAEAVIQVTEHDEVIGPISKLDSHHGEGKYHRAFSVLLFDSSGSSIASKKGFSQDYIPKCLGEFLLFTSTIQR